MARRRVLKRGPCSRSNFNDPNRVSLPAFLPSDPRLTGPGPRGPARRRPRGRPVPIAAAARRLRDLRRLAALRGGARRRRGGIRAATVDGVAAAGERLLPILSLAGVAALWLQRRRLPGPMEHPGP